MHTWMFTSICVHIIYVCMYVCIPVYLHIQPLHPSPHPSLHTNANQTTTQASKQTLRQTDKQPQPKSTNTPANKRAHTHTVYMLHLVQRASPDRRGLWRSVPSTVSRLHDILCGRPSHPTTRTHAQPPTPACPHVHVCRFVYLSVCLYNLYIRDTTYLAVCLHVYACACNLCVSV